MLGFIDNAWFQYVVDFGNAGPDRGKSGNFLIIPPGYEGDIPAGFYMAQSQTYGNWVVWRGFQVDGSPKPAVETTKKIFKVYPLSQKDNPPVMSFVNVSGKFHNTIHRMDYGYWEELNSVIQREPPEGVNPEIRGLLSAIGIEKGKEFNPDVRMKKILTDAANVAAVTARDLFINPYYDTEDVEFNYDIRNRIKRLDAGVSGGFGYKFRGTGMNLGITYYYGLLDIDKLTDTKNKNSTFYIYVDIPIGAGYKEEKQAGKME